MHEILVVEDDPVLGRGLTVNLESSNYKVHWAQSLGAAIQIYENVSPRLILLDVNLPDGSGLDFLRKIRAAGASLPVLILTAKTDELSVVEGLQAGANDYIRKPFGKLELLARIQTALKGPAEQTPQMQCGELLIRLDQRRVMFGDQEIEMKRREFDVLSYFVQHFDAVVTRETLITALNKESEIFDRTIDAHVSHVRARLKKAGVTSLQISSIYGVGYRLEKK